jgi:queuine/archaeosine tRNA-ribosyltransferase
LRRLGESFTERAAHNAYVFVSEVHQVRKALARGRLFSFVEKRLTHGIYKNILDNAVFSELKRAGLA